MSENFDPKVLAAKLKELKPSVVQEGAIVTATFDLQDNAANRETLADIEVHLNEPDMKEALQFSSDVEDGGASITWSVAIQSEKQLPSAVKRAWVDELRSTLRSIAYREQIDNGTLEGRAAEFHRR